jgi:hypothetical protein
MERITFANPTPRSPPRIRGGEVERSKTGEGFKSVSGKAMATPQKITHQFLEVVKISESPFDRAIVPIMLALGIVYEGIQALQGDWLELGFFALGIALLLALSTIKPLQERVLGQPFNRRHALHIGLYWVYSVVWLGLFRLLAVAPPLGKESNQFYFLVILIIALTWMMVRSLAILSLFFYNLFIARLAMWEQVIVAINEFIAAGVLAYVGSDILVRSFQPQVFSVRFDPLYTVGVVASVVAYYAGMQMMWVYHTNEWLSKNRTWVTLARVLAPLVLLVTTMAIVQRLSHLADPRTQNLLGNADFDLAILALAPVIWLVVLVMVLLLFVSRRGLRQRFLPDELLERLPPRIAQGFRTVSDMDMLLVIGLLSTFIPAYIFLLGDSGGLVGTLRQLILRRGSTLLETSEQALALLFVLPFYVLIVFLLTLYAYVLSRASLPAAERDTLVSRLPISFLIILIITLYLFAVPFSQVLTEGRLPQLQQELGRILLFNVVIPLLLLYIHYFLFIRLPYGRGQLRWRETQNIYLTRQLEDMDRRIENFNRELERLDQDWRDSRATQSEASTRMRMDMLYRYVQINGLRDSLNMQRLQIVASRQQLAEVSETPISLAVARLPRRVVSFGIPLLLAIQVYQWAAAGGLREIINNPNITVFQFFQILLQQANF